MEDRSQEINQLNLPFLEKMEIIENVRVLRLRGIIDHDTLPGILKVREQLTSGYNTNSLNILLDFQNVTDVDSSAIAYLSVRLEELETENHTLALVNIPKQLDNLLNIFNESSHFELFASEEEALKKLQQK